MLMLSFLLQLYQLLLIPIAQPPSDGMSGKAVASALANSGFITGITSSDVTTALGYTPL